MKNQKPLVLPVNEKSKTCLFYPYKALSVYESKFFPTLYYVHPELVHIHPKKGECTLVCPNCYAEVQTGIKPSNSIANGINFGWYECVGLTKPNIIEQNIIAHVHMYHSIVKIQNNKKTGSQTNYTGCNLKGHAILFPHDAPAIAPLVLLLSNCKDVQNTVIDHLLDECVTLQFVGPEGEMDYLAKETLGTITLTARAFVIYQWLAILPYIYPLYKQLGVLLSSFSDFQHVIS